MNNEYGMDIIHSELLDLLKRFDSICRNNGIRYSLYAGSLLGAVREKGFIPWDDDVDVILVHGEFEKLMNVLSEDDEFYIDSEDAWVPRFRRKNKKNGAFIDLFWMTNAPEKETDFKRKIFKLKALQGMLKKYKPEKKISLIYKMLLFGAKTIGMLFPRKYLLDRYNKIALCNEKQDTKLYSIPNAAFFYLKYRFEKNIYGDEYIDLPFEDMQAMAIKSWDYVLRMVYGDDYMTPPDEKDRKRSHANQMNL